MERIHYAGGTVLTGSEIARGLLEYAEALASTDGSATVDIPSLHGDGTIGRANFLIGPSSQLVSETEESPFDEIEDAELVAYFAHETSVLRGGHPVRPMQSGGFSDDFDDL